MTRDGLLGVLQAEQNLLVRLTAATAPINLRIAASSQRVISAALAARTTQVDLQRRWQTRADAYVLIGQTLRDVHPGHATHGAAAARESNNLIGRTAALPDEAAPDDNMLAAFDKRFTALDARFADLIENGVRDYVILRRRSLPRMDIDGPALVKPVRGRLAPIEAAGDSELLTIVRTRLRPLPDLAAPPKAADGRAALYTALVTEAPSDIVTPGRTSNAGAPKVINLRSECRCSPIDR